MDELRDCPNCEQGKHKVCTVEVLGRDDPPGILNFVPCPCAAREHGPIESTRRTNE